jgi:plastocyanin
VKTLTSENVSDLRRYLLRWLQAAFRIRQPERPAQGGHAAPVRQLTPRSSFIPMMFAVVHRRPSSHGAAHRLALLALVALLMGAATLLLTGGRASAQQAKKNAEIDGTAASKWEPAEVTIPVGGTVTFKISGGAPHPVEAGKAPNAGGSSPTGDNSFDTSKCQIAQMGTTGASCKVTFAKAGTFPFFCQVHFAQGMIGTITVGSGGGGTTATTTATTGAPTVSAPSAASGTTPAKPGVYWLGYALLGGGVLLAVAAVLGYLRFYPGFRRGR